MRSLGDVRARRAEKKRGEILRAGLKVFAEKGFRAATMDDIALELEATKGLLYYHFRTKEELLRAILEANALTAGIDALFTDVEGLPLEEALPQMSSRFVRLMEENAELVRFLHVQALLSEVEADVVYATVLDRLYRLGAALFERARERGELRDGVDTYDVARAIADSLIAHVIQAQIFGPRHRPGPHILDQAVDAWLHGVAARPLNPNRKENEG